MGQSMRRSFLLHQAVSTKLWPTVSCGGAAKVDDQPSRRNYDVIVVGAGPAGCSAATFLAKQGRRVLLVDKARFPRDKVCGDGISASSMDVMDRMGVSDKVERSKPWKITSIAVSSPKGLVIRNDVPPADGLRDYGYVIPRKDLDYILYQYAKSMPNVTALEGFRVKELLYDGQRVCGIRGRVGQTSECHQGAFILGADGAQSVISKAVSLQNRERKHRAFAVRAYYDRVEGLESCIEIHYERTVMPGYGWIFPTGEGSANVGVGVLNRFHSSKDIKRWFNIFVERNAFAKKKLKNARMIEGSFGGWPITLGAFSAKRSVKNVLLVGDAGSFVDPLSGEGIYYALRSGEYAACAIETGLRKGGCAEKVGGVFEALWKKEFKWKEFIPGHIMQPFLSNGFLLESILNRAHQDPKRAARLTAAMAHKIPKRRLLLGGI